jgi:hypothetical protein
VAGPICPSTDGYHKHYYYYYLSIHTRTGESGQARTQCFLLLLKHHSPRTLLRALRAEGTQETLAHKAAASTASSTVGAAGGGGGRSGDVEGIVDAAAVSAAVQALNALSKTDIVEVGEDGGWTRLPIWIIYVCGSTYVYLIPINNIYVYVCFKGMYTCL